MSPLSCCWYHKGTNFQANHNRVLLMKYILLLLLIPQRYEFSSKSQQTAGTPIILICCCWYHKGTNFQANHNQSATSNAASTVVVDTTKVRIFKQITTGQKELLGAQTLLLIPQRYEFSSKSQQRKRYTLFINSCCWYHKGTNFQANHNSRSVRLLSSVGCCWYHKGTNFQANHNFFSPLAGRLIVVVDTTKVRIFKQITTKDRKSYSKRKLLLIPQRYEFSSKSQQKTTQMFDL